ncbi:VOC family protein [Cereibacter sphaeroides]|nr:VOC family protein [Cereibacter sphaeroides]
MSNDVFSYVTVGTSDLTRAAAFYDAALGALGLERLHTDVREIGYGRPGGPCRFWANLPFDGQTMSVGNGSMPCFQALSRAEVTAFHAAGLAAGGTDEGAPGLRPYGPHFFAAYLRDPDGNKLSAVCEFSEG